MLQTPIHQRLPRGSPRSEGNGRPTMSMTPEQQGHLRHTCQRLGSERRAAAVSAEHRIAELEEEIDRLSNLHQPAIGHPEAIPRSTTAGEDLEALAACVRRATATHRTRTELSELEAQADTLRASIARLQDQRDALASATSRTMENLPAEGVASMVSPEEELKELRRRIKWVPWSDAASTAASRSAPCSTASLYVTEGMEQVSRCGVQSDCWFAYQQLFTDYVARSAPEEGLAAGDDELESTRSYLDDMNEKLVATVNSTAEYQQRLSELQRELDDVNRVAAERTGPSRGDAPTEGELSTLVERHDALGTEVQELLQELESRPRPETTGLAVLEQQVTSLTTAIASSRSQLHYIGGEELTEAALEKDACLKTIRTELSELQAQRDALQEEHGRNLAAVAGLASQRHAFQKAHTALQAEIDGLEAEGSPEAIYMRDRMMRQDTAEEASNRTGEDTTAPSSEPVASRAALLEKRRELRTRVLPILRQGLEDHQHQQQQQQAVPTTGRNAAASSTSPLHTSSSSHWLFGWIWG